MGLFTFADVKPSEVFNRLLGSVLNLNWVFELDTSLFDDAGGLNSDQIQMRECILKFLVALTDFPLLSSHIFQDVFDLFLLVTSTGSEHYHTSYFGLKTMSFESLVVLNIL